MLELKNWLFSLEIWKGSSNSNKVTKGYILVSIGKKVSILKFDNKKTEKVYKINKNNNNRINWE